MSGHSSVASLRDGLDLERVGGEMHGLASRLYPICRSITGDGFRQTLDVLEETLPLRRIEVPTGTRVFDWTVPQEWNVRDAWVKDSGGQKIVDFTHHTLHLVNYSAPFHGSVSRSELLAHLHSLPEHPTWIPYRTAYYDEQWGFCVTDRVKQQLPEGPFEVKVETTLADGTLTYAEHDIAGATSEDVLISSHGCHPSLANDNLSGLVVTHRLAALLDATSTRYTYRFVILPGTIGAITWLAQNQERATRIRHGLVLTCLGDAGGLTYKRSRRGDAIIDRTAVHVLGTRGAHRILPFDPSGYAERQFCSPGFDLPVGRLTRTPHDQFPEYHTSADNLELITPRSLSDSLDALLAMIEVLEGNRMYRNTNPMCEPFFHGRGVKASPALQWVLNLSDGRQTLLDIAERSARPFREIRDAADQLIEHRLLEPVDVD